MPVNRNRGSASQSGISRVNWLHLQNSIGWKRQPELSLSRVCLTHIGISLLEFNYSIWNRDCDAIVGIN